MQQAQRWQQLFLAEGFGTELEANTPDASNPITATITAIHRVAELKMFRTLFIEIGTRVARPSDYLFFSAASISFTYLSGSLLKSFRQHLQQSFTSRSL